MAICLRDGVGNEGYLVKCFWWKTGWSTNRARGHTTLSDAERIVPSLAAVLDELDSRV